MGCIWVAKPYMSMDSGLGKGGRLGICRELRKA